MFTEWIAWVMDALVVVPVVKARSVEGGGVEPRMVLGTQKPITAPREMAHSTTRMLKPWVERNLAVAAYAEASSPGCGRATLEATKAVLVVPSACSGH